MDPKITDALTVAAANWVTMAALQLRGERLDVFGQCFGTDGTDIRVEVLMRQGTLFLAAVNFADNTRYELYRQEVEPLRPAMPFVTPERGERH
jgi:hypothetical protein